MGIIAAIRAKLLRYPHLRYTADARSISVEPQDTSGFTVSIFIDGDRHTVRFDGWHEEFADGGQALECFALGLSDSCRLGVTYRGNTATKWVLESRGGANEPWVVDSETGLLFIPFWRCARVVHRQNRLISGPPGG